MDTREQLNGVVSWLNHNYHQDSENYDIFMGAKPDVIKYDEHTAISTWACGAIVCIYDMIYFLDEDDGHWFLREEEKDYYPDYGFQGKFSIGWAKSFTSAMERLIDYVEKNGEPVYFSGLEEKIICHYTL